MGPQIVRVSPQEPYSQPSRLAVGRRPNVKVIDYGVPRHRSQDKNEEEALVPRVRTRSGQCARRLRRSIGQDPQRSLGIARGADTVHARACDVLAGGQIDRDGLAGVQVGHWSAIDEDARRAGDVANLGATFILKNR